MFKKKKQFLGLLLAGLLLIPAIPAAAETTIMQGTIYINEAYPTPCNVLTGYDFFDSYAFQFVPIANAFGYTTTYHGETQTVTSEKDGRMIRMVLNQNDITITENGQEQKLYGKAIEFEGSTYLNYYAFGSLFNIYAYQGETKKNELYLYTKDAVTQQIEEKLKNNILFFNAFQLPDSFDAQLSLQIDGRADSETFGIHFNGGLKIDAAMSRNGEWTALDLTINTDGLSNLIRFFTHPALSNEIENLKTINLNEPLNASLRYNNDTLYVKADGILALTELYNSLPHNTPDTYKNSLQAQLQDKWICYQMDSFIREKLAIVQKCLQPELEVSQIADAFALQFGDSNSVFPAIDAISTLHEQITAITHEDGTLSVKTTLPADTVQQFLTDFAVIDQSWLDVLTISAASDMTVIDGQSFISSVTSDIGITNIPNSYGLQCGTADGTITGTVSITKGAEEIAAPENAVAFQSIYDGAAAEK